MCLPYTGEFRIPLGTLDDVVIQIHFHPLSANNLVQPEVEI
jgi:hypothetical protein